MSNTPELIKQFDDANVVSMVTMGSKVFIATSRSIYVMDVPVERQPLHTRILNWMRFWK